MRFPLAALLGLCLGHAFASAPAPSGFATLPDPGDAIAAADTGENDDSIVAEADSAARAAMTEAASGGGEAEAKPPLWLETYGEGVYSSQEDDNLAGFADWKVGKRLPGRLQADVYAKFRFYRDQRDFYWNNRADGGLGLRLPLLRKFSLTAFAEATWGRYLNLSSGTVAMDRLQARIESNRTAISHAQELAQDIFAEALAANANYEILQDSGSDRETLEKAQLQAKALLDSLGKLNLRLDTLETAKDSLAQAMDSIALVPSGEVTEYKIGLVFWHGWGGPPDDADPPTAWFAFPFRPWGEVYADCIGSALERHVRVRREGGAYADSAVHINNVILYANPSVGWMVMEGKAGSLAAFAAAYAWFDSHGDWWNNRAMGGPGLRYQPFRNVDLLIKAEYLWGGFYGRERKSDPNPYGPSFTDTRVTASFWHGLGM